MQIRFDPSVDQTITVSPSLIASHSPSYALVRFTAVVEDGEYEQINKGGARIQLWANDLSGTGSSSEWQEHDFTEDKLHVGKLEVSGRRLSLHLRATLPRSVEELQFSYTYRVLYQDGRVEWLGRFGQNGSCVVHRHRHSSVAILSDQWHSDDGVAYHRDVHGLSTSPLQLLSGLDSDRFNLYAINSDGAIGYTEDCSLLFIAPKYYPDSHALPQAFSISSSPGNSISFSPTGTIYVNDMAKTSLLLQVYDIQTDLLHVVESVIAHSIPSKVRVLYFDRQNGLLVLVTASDHRYPVRLAAIGLFPEADMPTVEVELKLRDFKKLSIMGATTGVCIYPGFGMGISTIVWDRTSAAERVSLRPGIQYTLSPEYCMRSGGDLWRISILSDHADINAFLRQPEVDPLPTPPPSPPEIDASKEGAKPTVGEVWPMKSVAKSIVGLFGRYMRYCFSVLIMPVAIFFRILSVFRGVISRRKSHGREENSVPPSRANRMDPKRKKDRATQPTSMGVTVVGQESAGSSRDRLCKSLSARVFPGLLTILLRSEAGVSTDNASNIPHMKLGDERWDGSIERKDERTFLLTTFIEKERNIEITPA